MHIHFPLLHLQLTARHHRFSKKGLTFDQGKVVLPTLIASLSVFLVVEGWI